MDTFLVLKALSVGLSGNANDEVPNEDIVAETSMQRFIQLQSRDLSMPNCLPPYQHSNYPGSNATLSKSCFGTHNKDVSPLNMESWVQEKNLDSKPDWVITNEEVARQRLRNRNEPSELEKFLTSFASEPTRHASNNWAVSGNLTDTGFPIVCNDPHLPYTAPMVWFLIGLDVTDDSSPWQNIVGATVIMAPGIGLGKNNYYTWGYTTDHADTQDVYFMKNTPDNTGYYYRNEIHTYTQKTATITVKDMEPITETFLYSVYGPVIVDNDGTYYSVTYPGFNDTDSSIVALIDSNIGTNLDEFRNAMSKWWSLLFNAAYGDKEGNILFQAVGAIPIRQSNDFGYLPKIGDGSSDWIGITAWEDMPHSINPPDGYVVTANNPLGKLQQLSHPFEGTYVPGFRAQRIIDLILDEINSGNLITVDYMKQIQGDVTDLVFSYLYTAIENLQVSNPTDIEYKQKLLAWDGVESTISTMAPIFDSWLYCLYNVTFYEIGSDTRNPYLMKQWFSNPNPSGTGDDISCSYWNQTCSQYAASCFSSSVNYYVEELGLPEWGSIHQGFFLHIPPLPLRWNRLVPVGGSKYVPNAATFTVTVPGIPFEAIVGGPSVRLISDLSGTTPTQLIMPMGESGNPKSSHYDDMLSMWANLQYLNLDWTTIEQ